MIRPNPENAARISVEIRAYLRGTFGAEPAADVAAAISYELAAAIASAADGCRRDAFALLDAIVATMRDQIRVFPEGMEHP